MRDIKFRAWDNQFGKWANLPDLAKRSKLTLKDDGQDDTHILNLTAFLKRLTLMQYTGLKDKNDKEIYEGDIVLHHDKNYLVKWDDYMAAFQTENVHDKVDADFFNWGNVPSLQTQGVPDFTGDRFEGNCEVIGNIYENPELLK